MVHRRHHRHARRLISKLQEKGTGREAHWAALTSRKLFTRPHDAGSATLQHLVRRPATRVLARRVHDLI